MKGEEEKYAMCFLRERNGYETYEFSHPAAGFGKWAVCFT